MSRFPLTAPLVLVAVLPLAAGSACSDSDASAGGPLAPSGAPDSLLAPVGPVSDPSPVTAGSPALAPSRVPLPAGSSAALPLGLVPALYEQLVYNQPPFGVFRPNPPLQVSYVLPPRAVRRIVFDLSSASSVGCPVRGVVPVDGDDPDDPATGLDVARAVGSYVTRPAVEAIGGAPWSGQVSVSRTPVSYSDGVIVARFGSARAPRHPVTNPCPNAVACSTVGYPAGAIFINLDPACRLRLRRSGRVPGGREHLPPDVESVVLPERFRRLWLHELGHAFGFWHVSRAGFVMQTDRIWATDSFQHFEQVHMHDAMRRGPLTPRAGLLPPPPPIDLAGPFFRPPGPPSGTAPPCRSVERVGRCLVSN